MIMSLITMHMVYDRVAIIIKSHICVISGAGNASRRKDNT